MVVFESPGVLGCRLHLGTKLGTAWMRRIAPQRTQAGGGKAGVLVVQAAKVGQREWGNSGLDPNRPPVSAVVRQRCHRRLHLQSLFAPGGQRAHCPRPDATTDCALCNTPAHSVGRWRPPIRCASVGQQCPGHCVDHRADRSAALACATLPCAHGTQCARSLPRNTQRHSSPPRHLRQCLSVRSRMRHCQVACSKHLSSSRLPQWARHHSCHQGATPRPSSMPGAAVKHVSTAVCVGSSWLPAVA
jgi:hypothetical protein